VGSGADLVEDERQSEKLLQPHSNMLAQSSALQVSHAVPF
jgi:hypothetical protein